MMAERGVTVTYETIRAWCERFGREYTKRIRARRGKLGDTWHLDEVFIKIGGRLQYLWRAVDQDGSVLDILVQSRRSKKAAARLFRRLRRGLRYPPRVVVTDKLASYNAPRAELLLWCAIISRAEFGSCESATNLARCAHVLRGARNRRCTSRCAEIRHAVLSVVGINTGREPRSS
jgi:putative transposase